MKLHDILIENPIGTFQTIGDFTQSHGFRHASDRVLVTNPKSVANTIAKFGKTGFNLNMFFDNKVGAGKHAETGNVSLQGLGELLGDDVAEIVKDSKDFDDSINIIYVGNSAAERRPLTPWVMAHRLAHALAVRAPFKDVASEISAILRVAYGIGKGNQVNAENNIMQAFLEAIGTYQSARQHNLRNFYEGVYEMFAQYVITGDIKFNPLPRSFVVNRGGFRKTTYRVLNDDAYRDGQEMLDTFANTLPYWYYDELSAAIGNIYIM